MNGTTVEPVLLAADPVFPPFDIDVAPGGYAWWYVDAVSDDGRYGFTLIALLGSVFSPYYARARRRNPAADPLSHCTLNVVLYGPRRKRWCFTERPRSRVQRSATSLTLGPSALAWDGATLTCHIDEVTVPLPGRLRGTLSIHAEALTGRRIELDAAGRHEWRPVSPIARIEACLTEPRVSFTGHAYLDANRGAEPLEAAFADWDWSRASSDDAAAILYDVRRLDGTRLAVALQADRQGWLEPRKMPPISRLPPTPIWRQRRTSGADTGHRPRVVRTYEDTPFYSRSQLGTRLFGRDAAAVHESLDLRRFAAPWVQMLLPFRAPRSPF